MTTLASDTSSVGVDFGTESGRAVIIRNRDGAAVGEALRAYGHAELAILGGGTNLRNLKQSLRLSDLYHVVAQGLRAWHVRSHLHATGAGGVLRASSPHSGE